MSLSANVNRLLHLLSFWDYNIRNNKYQGQYSVCVRERGGGEKERASERERERQTHTKKPHKVKGYLYVNMYRLHPPQQKPKHVFVLPLLAVERWQTDRQAPTCQRAASYEIKGMCICVCVCVRGARHGGGAAATTCNHSAEDTALCLQPATREPRYSGRRPHCSIHRPKIHRASLPSPLHKFSKSDRKWGIIPSFPDRFHVQQHRSCECSR